MCLNFSYFQSTLHLMQYTYQDTFSTAQSSFWICWFWYLLVLLPYFCFTSSTLAKLFPLRDFLIWGNEKSLFGWDQVNRESGAWGSCRFLSKNFWTCSMVWAGVLVNHPSWNGQMCRKRLQKKFTEAKHSLSQLCQVVHWYRWVPRTLTWQGKPVL